MVDVFRKEYRKLLPDEVAKLEALKDRAQLLHNAISELPPNRETSLAKTKLEEAVMWAVKAITA